MEKSIKRYMTIFVLPTFFAFILGFIVPFIMGIWLSFCKFTTTERGDPAGTDSCDAEKTMERDVTFPAGIRIVIRCNVRYGW